MDFNIQNNNNNSNNNNNNNNNNNFKCQLSSKELHNLNIKNILNNCLIQKIIVGFCWRDTYSCRRWKISLSLVSWRFHYFISMYCSENLDLTRSEETMTLEKDINIFYHYKLNKFTLFRFSPKKIQISTNDFKRLFRIPLLSQQSYDNNNSTTTTAVASTTTTSTNSSFNIVSAIRCLFSALESIELEYNGYSMEENDLALLFSSVDTIKNVSVQFNGKCCFKALSQLNKCLNNLRLESFSLLFLEEDGGRSDKIQIKLPVVMSTTTIPQLLSSTFQKCTLSSSSSSSSLGSGVITTPSSAPSPSPSTTPTTTCIRSYISSKNVSNLKSLHLESVSIFMLQELVCSLHHNRLNNLKDLIIIFDDSNLFSSISSEAFFSGLSRLPKLRSLYLSLSIVFFNVVDQEKFNIGSFQKYLQEEKTLETLSIDFISDDMSRVFNREFIEFLFQEKVNLKKLRINTPVFTSFISENNRLTSLTLDYQAHLKCCQLLEIDNLINNISGKSRNLKKLVLLNDNRLFVNTFISRLLTNDRNGSIENLKASIGKQEFSQILNSLSTNTTLKTLTLLTSNDITQDHIQSLLLTIQDHPSLYKIVIETNCTTLCPYFLKNNFSIYYNYIKLKYYIFKK
ncbi:hypothetical protein DDB_G0290497 [Dictyostelium discoideum AX4]|uniref:Uncharacterized protein n=1 Tax=Dictyostelium discoideum TaxID=44689 RepID=Q54G08_DICDI|nr:hypothetical protein DDB_G0290497 [Dictyostelium discoideum AX4]EAL62109.1 hypothetical protein DDB_G0290497 [Dictyostelium discoideum AX4]|eukprot:XP_635609.1 hypothetical protein DDB_G0290497 [Dictyostelium discoideum AX4]